MRTTSGCNTHTSLQLSNDSRRLWNASRAPGLRIRTSSCNALETAPDKDSEDSDDTNNEGALLGGVADGWGTGIGGTGNSVVCGSILDVLRETNSPRTVTKATARLKPECDLMTSIMSRSIATCTPLFLKWTVTAMYTLWFLLRVDLLQSKQLHDTAGIGHVVLSNGNMMKKRMTNY